MVYSAFSIGSRDAGEWVMLQLRDVRELWVICENSQISLPIFPRHFSFALSIAYGNPASYTALFMSSVCLIGSDRLYLFSFTPGPLCCMCLLPNSSFSFVILRWHQSDTFYRIVFLLVGRNCASMRMLEAWLTFKKTPVFATCWTPLVVINSLGVNKFKIGLKASALASSVAFPDTISSFYCFVIFSYRPG